MTIKLRPIRIWSKSPQELNEEALNKIERGEMVEVPQGEDNPSKFLYRDMGGNLHWVKLQPYEIGEEVNESL